MTAIADSTTGPRANYPVRLSMEYPERLSRVSTLFRVILLIPVLLFLYVLQANVTAAIWAAVMVKGRIPRWLFDFQVGANRFTHRASAYFLLITDKYPAFEGEWPLRYQVDYPDHISRWRILFWKLITSLPHAVVLAILWIGVFFVVTIGWFAVLISGRFPRGLHEFVVGVLRWSARVAAYFQSLTDEMPPFSMGEDDGPASASTSVLAAIGGGLFVLLLIAGGIVGGIAIYGYANETKSVEVAYASALSAGAPAIKLDNVIFGLKGGQDPTTIDAFKARPGYHLVEFTLTYENRRFVRQTGRHDVETSTVQLRTSEHGTVDPGLLTVDGYLAPIDVAHERQWSVRAIFEVADGDRIEELRGSPSGGGRHVAWKFR